jgi:hypothetical protein
MDAPTSANALENHIHEIAKNLHRTLKLLKQCFNTWWIHESQNARLPSESSSVAANQMISEHKFEICCSSAHPMHI